MPSDHRGLLEAAAKAAIRSAQPDVFLRPRLPSPPTGRLRVACLGKAARSMAQIACETYDTIDQLVCVTNEAAEPGLERPKWWQDYTAAHPDPDDTSVAAAEVLWAQARSLDRDDDLLLVLLSGGGSSLAALPAEGLTISEQRSVMKALMRAGADISELNCVRRHLSQIKGGRLAAAAYPARTFCIALSDVVGDHPHDIASGPTVPDPTTLADARVVLDRYAIARTPALETVLTRNESPKEGDPSLQRTEIQVINGARTALDAMASTAAAGGFKSVLIGECLVGEASDAARQHASLAREYLAQGEKVALISGGELTVTLHDTPGSGGPNQHYILALMQFLKGEGGISALACDSDGIDGCHADGRLVAGAVMTPDTWSRLASKGVSASRALTTSDSGTALKAVGALLDWGPTGTNVNDLRIILVEPH